MAFKEEFENHEKLTNFKHELRNLLEKHKFEIKRDIYNTVPFILYGREVNEFDLIELLDEVGVVKK